MGGRCRDKEYHKKYYLKNREKEKARSAAYRLAHPEQTKASFAKYYAKNRVRRNKYRTISHLFNTYGLTLSNYIELKCEQKGLCKLCGMINNGWALAVDHDHKTGKVRGLLCDNCNTGIGMLKDSPELLKKAINYLEENKNVN